MGHGLSRRDQEIEERARAFVDDELIPWEVHAEMNQGEIPGDVADRHEKLARELGFTAIPARSGATTTPPIEPRTSIEWPFNAP